MGALSPADARPLEGDAPEEGMPLEERRLEERRTEANGVRSADAPSVPLPPLPARALLEAIDRDGHVRQVWAIRHWPARIGRALDNDVVLTDPHVAPHHCRLDRPADGPLRLETGETVNGVLVGTRRIGAGMAAELLPERDGEIELVAGRTRLRLRLAEAPLAPELPLATQTARRLRVVPTLVLAALLVGGVAFATYLDSDPDNFVRGLGNTLLAGLAVAALWCGAWALLS